MPAGYDAEVAELFRDLRSASGLSEADLAAQLATRPEVVQALEQGALYALPPWPETYRVVATYGTLLNLDVRPLLRRIYAQVDAGVVGLAPKSMPDVPFMAPPESIGREFQGQAPVSAPGLRTRHRIDSLPRARHKPPNRGRSLSRIRSRCRNSSRNGRRSQEERRPRNAGRPRWPPSSHAQCRRRPVRREPRHRLISLNLARHSRRERRRWRKTRHARPFPGRRSSSGAWSPLSSWGSRPVSGCGWPSPVRSVPAQILDSLVPNRRTRVRQPT